MGFQFLSKSDAAKCRNLILCFLVTIICLGSFTGAKKNEPFNIGAIIDVDSRAGKEQQTAMIMAVESFNKISPDHKLNLHFRSISNNPIQAISSAEELIRKKKVGLMIGLQTWEQSALVAEVGKRARVPVLSLASSSLKPLLMQQRWPFLVPVSPDSSDQIACIAAIVGSFHWRKVVAIYEDNSYGGDSELLAVLSEALQEVDAEIESHLVLPPASSVADLEGMVQDEVEKLLRSQSRVFIVLRSSLSLASYLFKEAKNIGLIGRDSVWIISDSLTNLLDSVNSSFLSSMQGVLGTKSFYSEESKAFVEFKTEFKRVLRLEFPDEHNLEPGIHALHAYDAITAVTKVVMGLGSRNHSTNTSMSLLSMIRSSNFTGLAGEVRFQDEALLSSTSVFRIVNVVGKRYKELGFWSSRFGFTDSLPFENGKINFSAVDGVESMLKLPGLVNWPGELNRTPKGWAMPTDAKPMRIGVPGRTTFDKFVRVYVEDNVKKYEGFCIDVFKAALEIVKQKYTLPYEFHPYNGSYPDLVNHLINKTFDAIVGDITILANRSQDVDFTQPYTESGLSMLVPVRRESQRTWLFMKPFTVNMWITTLGIMFYTMFVVWFLEHQTNPEFRGPWKDQLGTALWFTFSSLFFAHRENIKSHYSKVVLAVWLFLVFVITSSYTASLTSMLTIPRLKPNVTDIEWVRRTNAPVGCDGDSFVKAYLRDVLQLTNIKDIGKPDSYPGEFDSGNITVAFLELPYQKVFLREYCNNYTVVGPSHRFGGLGFAFQKGSPVARDFSQAILTLMENGKLNQLEDASLGTSMNCSNSDDSLKTESLHLESFWILFLISGSTSTICFLIFVARLLRSHRELQETYHNDGTQGHNGIKGIPEMMVELKPQSRLSGSTRSIDRARTFARRWSSSRWNLASPEDESEHFEFLHQKP